MKRHIELKFNCNKELSEEQSTVLSDRLVDTFYRTIGEYDEFFYDDELEIEFTGIDGP